MATAKKKLDTFGFLKMMASNTLAGDPLKTIDDVKDTIEEEPEDDTVVVETTAEEVTNNE